MSTFISVIQIVRLRDFITSKLNDVKGPGTIPSPYGDGKVASVMACWKHSFKIRLDGTITELPFCKVILSEYNNVMGDSSDLLAKNAVVDDPPLDKTNVAVHPDGTTPTHSPDIGEADLEQGRAVSKLIEVVEPLPSEASVSYVFASPPPTVEPNVKTEIEKEVENVTADEYDFKPLALPHKQRNGNDYELGYRVTNGILVISAHLSVKGKCGWNDTKTSVRFDIDEKRHVARLVVIDPPGKKARQLQEVHKAGSRYTFRWPHEGVLKDLFPASKGAVKLKVISMNQTGLTFHLLSP
jgi:hypothetical protein